MCGMDRPFAEERPVGPFVGSDSSSPNGVAFVYTVSDFSHFPSTGQASTELAEAYRSERDRGVSDVVAADPSVDVVGSPRSDTRAVRVTTDVTIMNMDQFEATKKATDKVMSQYFDYSTVAVAVPNP